MHTYRQSRSTVMNDVSSRSHCLARLNLSVVTGEDLGQVRTNQNTPSGHVTTTSSLIGQVTRSSLNMVDLAGSERLEKTEMEAKSTTAAYEGLSTNWDLFHFGRTIGIILLTLRKLKEHKN